MRCQNKKQTILNIHWVFHFFKQLQTNWTDTVDFVFDNEKYLHHLISNSQLRFMFKIMQTVITTTISSIVAIWQYF